MKAHKTLLPANREPLNHSPQLNQIASKSSVGQTFNDFYKILQREAFFGLQLLLAFSVSYTAVQLTRGWLSESGMVAPTPSSYSARVFWPENTLALFPKPSQPGAAVPESTLKGAEASLASLNHLNQSTQAKADLKSQAAAKALAADAPTPTVTRTASRTPVRLYTSPLKNQQAYRWAATKPRNTARYLAQSRYNARRPVQQAARRRPVYRAPVRVAVQPKAAVKQRLNPAVRPVQRVLSQDYRVSQLKSYDEYMIWVRRTLKEYKGG